MTAVIGLDLSLQATGCALVDGSTTTLRTSPARGDRRLLDIAATIQHIAAAVDLAVIEDLPTHARAAGAVGMVHGVVRALLLEMRVPYALVPPATLKAYATGKGNATKPDLRMALYQRAALDLRDDDQVDAWWLRAAGLDRLGAPVVTLPAAQRARLDKVTWPVMPV